jgi:hypothetical protein
MTSLFIVILPRKHGNRVYIPGLNHGAPWIDTHTTRTRHIAPSRAPPLPGARLSGDTVRTARHALASDGAVMIEIFVEHWSNGEVIRHPWSIWVDGKQLAGSHGRREYASQDDRSLMRGVSVTRS